MIASIKTTEHFGISIVIRTRDSKRGFCDLLKVLSVQTVKPSQLIIVDY